MTGMEVLELFLRRFLQAYVGIILFICFGAFLSYALFYSPPLALDGSWSARWILVISLFAAVAAFGVKLLVDYSERPRP